MFFDKITIILFLLLLSKPCKSFLNQKANKMLKTAQKYYKSKFHKDTTQHFLGYDQSEYPGANEKYREIHRKKWNEYYTCLRAQFDNIGEHRSVIPEAFQGFEGGSISFDCKICLSPKEREKMDVVIWYWAPLSSQELIEIEYTEHILLSPEDKTLTLYNLREDQTGQYMCKLGGSLTTPYFLTVVNSSSPAIEVHTEFAKEGPHATPLDQISEHNLVLDTVWGDWSLCSTCDKTGKRHKFGYCIVYMETQQSEETNNTNHQLNKQNILTSTTEQNVQENNTQTNTTESNTEKSKLKQFVQNVKTFISKAWKKKNQTNNTATTKKPDASYLDNDLQLLRIFQNGIPCLSHILPKSIKQLIRPKNRTNEIMVGYCKVTCSKDSVFEVRDKNGKVIERANNSAGIYSMLQGMPPQEPQVSRLLQYGEKGKHIVISCPGNLNSDTPIQWQVGSKKMIPELIAQQSNGRIYVSVLDRINIKMAQVSDSNIYSCWQNNDLAGSIRLVVEKKVKMTFNHHIMLFGMVIILSVFLYVITKAFFGRKYARITK